MASASYGKRDFLSWDDDIDLDQVLGEYTDVENNKCDASSTGASVKEVLLYVCPVCSKEYKSISGFRGHVMKKHDLNIKAADHRKGANKDDKEECPNSCQTNIFKDTFASAYVQSIHNIQTEAIYNLFGQSPEANIATCCKDDEEIKLFFKGAMEDCFNGNSGATAAERELLFQRAHSIRLEDEVLKDGIAVLSKRGITGVATVNMNNFIQFMILELIRCIFRCRVELEKVKSCEKSEELTDNDQKVLFYISGYIVRALERKYAKLKNKTTRTTKMESIKELCSQTSEKTFTTKYATWFERKDRGGLKKPSDNFFFLIREFENVLRHHIDLDKISSVSIKKQDLKEKVLESYMVKYYQDQLFLDNEQGCEYVEDILNVFVTVRGYAIAKLVQNKANLKAHAKAKSSASLREALKSISNSVANL